MSFGIRIYSLIGWVVATITTFQETHKTLVWVVGALFTVSAFCFRNRKYICSWREFSFLFKKMPLLLSDPLHNKNVEVNWKNTLWVPQEPPKDYRKKYFKAVACLSYKEIKDLQKVQSDWPYKGVLDLDVEKMLLDLDCIWEYSTKNELRDTYVGYLIAISFRDLVK